MRASFWVTLAWMVVGPVNAFAQDQPLRLLAEPISYTDVADAFDGLDPFDLNFSITFRRQSTSGTIQRERSTSGVGSNRYVDIAEHDHTRNILELGTEVGLYQDLMAYLRLPIILSDDRELSALDSAGARARTEEVLSQTNPDGSQGPLFAAPFQAPTRSGLGDLGVGAAWSIYNQYRDPGFPTWTIRAEGRVSLGPPMRACAADARYGDDLATENVEDRRCNGSSDPGATEGLNSIRLETRASKRFRYLEPYAGLAFQIGWPGSSGDLFEPGGNLSGFVNTIPPRRGEFMAGMAIIPWEHPARWQRFAVHLRVNGAYISEGHGYSPLFDALGTSSSPHLRSPNQECPGCTRQVGFTGLTDMQAHGRLGGGLSVEMQAARYVSFIAGAGLTWTSPYLLTFADPCNTGVSAQSDDPRRSVCSEGVLNPHHRPAIDQVGNRFRLDGAWTLDLSVTAVAKF